LPDYQDVTTFQILNQNDYSSFNIIATTGVVKFNVSPNYKLKNEYQLVVKAIDNLGNTDTAHFKVTIIPLPPEPVKGDTAVYKLNADSAPSTFATLVTQPKDGAEIRWRFAESTVNSWVDTLPRLPDSVGRYSYIVKAFDPLTGLFSKDSSVVKIVIRPFDPITRDSTYIIGAKSNPLNIGIQVKGMPRNIFNYFKIDSVLVKSISTEAPPLPKTVGTYKFAVNQIVNTVESDTLPFTVNMISKQDVFDLVYLIDSAKLQHNSTFNLPMKVVLKNKLNKPLDSVMLSTNIKNMIPIGADYKIIDITSGKYLSANKFFDGATSTDLLSNATLFPGLATDTIGLVINIIPNGFSGVIQNNIYIDTKTPYGWMSTMSSNKFNDDLRNPTNGIVPEVVLNIPEGFSPNNDGIDDNWVINRPFGTTISVKVFNRWGNEVYSNSNYQNNWSGKGVSNFIGEDVPSGTYFYIVEATDMYNVKRKFASSLTIVR